MTKIQKVIRDINNLQDFYKKTKVLRLRVKAKSSPQVTDVGQDAAHAK